MYQLTQVTSTNSSKRNPPGASVSRSGYILVGFTFTAACLALSPPARAVCQQGCGSNANTFLGDNALISNTTGSDNTAIGFATLSSSTTGLGNTAMGFNALISNTTGNANTAIGDVAMNANTTGGANTAVGFEALFSNTAGNNMTAIGVGALFANTTGTGSTGIGDLALFNNSAGNSNTATGSAALFENTTGSANTANGANALISNTTGDNNTANGTSALSQNSTGGENTANGVDALFRNTIGDNNTAEGFSALSNNSSGTSNTANGVNALFSNTTGGSNTANGRGALYHNSTASNNTADGYQALVNNTTGANNTACGLSALYNNTTGSNNIALGVSAGSNLTTGSNNIDVGGLGASGESNTIRLGKVGVQTATYIIGIRGATVAGGVSVMVDSAGHLGTITSSERYKDAIRPMDKASEAILTLKPVTFRYKHELDPAGIRQFGLVAEQVDKVNPDLVARDDQGKPYTVRYEAVNAMLLNEFLKEHRKVEEQEARITQLKADDTHLKATVGQQQAINAEQQKEIQALAASLKEQALRIQKVSDQLERNKSTPRVVANNP